MTSTSLTRHTTITLLHCRPSPALALLLRGGSRFLGVGITCLAGTVSRGHKENRDEGVRRGFLAVFLTRGHPTARFLNHLSARKGALPPPAATPAARPSAMADSPKNDAASIDRRARHCPHAWLDLRARRGTVLALFSKLVLWPSQTSSGELRWLHMYGSFA